MTGKMSLLRSFAARNALISEQQGEQNDSASLDSNPIQTSRSNLSFQGEKETIPSINLNALDKTVKSHLDKLYHKAWQKKDTVNIIISNIDDEVDYKKKDLPN